MVPLENARHFWWVFASEVHEALCGPQPNPQLAHCRGGELGTDPVHGVGSDAMRTAGVAP